METLNQTSLKDVLIEAAKKLFWAKGIRGVSIEEICKTAQVSKMSFYRNFKNKEAIAFKVLDTIHQHSQSTYRSIMDQKTTFEQKIKALIQMEYDQIKGVSRAFIEEVYGHSPFQEQIKSYQKKIQKEVLHDFGNAQKKGEIRQDIKMEFILYILQDMNKKMVDPELQRLYDSEEEIAMELTRFFFYGIFAPHSQ